MIKSSFLKNIKKASPSFWNMPDCANAVTETKLSYPKPTDQIYSRVQTIAGKKINHRW